MLSFLKFSCFLNYVIPATLQLLQNSLEHDMHDADDCADEGAMISSEKTSSSDTQVTIWNAKVSTYNSMFQFMNFIKLYMLQVVAQVINR